MKDASKNVEFVEFVELVESWFEFVELTYAVRSMFERKQVKEMEYNEHIIIVSMNNFLNNLLVADDTIYFNAIISTRDMVYFVDEYQQVNICRWYRVNPLYRDIRDVLKDCDISYAEYQSVVMVGVVEKHKELLCDNENWKKLYDILG